MDARLNSWSNNKTSHPNKLLINLPDKSDLQRGEKGVILSTFSI